MADHDEIEVELDTEVEEYAVGDQVLVNGKVRIGWAPEELGFPPRSSPHIPPPTRSTAAW